MKKIFLTALFVGFIAGAPVYADVATPAQNSALSAYQTCLQQNPGNGSACSTISSQTANGQGQNLTYTPLEPIQGVNTNNPSLSSYLSGMYRLAITVGALLAVVILTWSGIQLMTAESVGVLTSAKQRIRNSLWGLIIIVGSFLILYTLNPSTLTFNFNPQQAITGSLTPPPAQPTSFQQYQDQLTQNVNSTHTSQDCSSATQWLKDNGAYSQGGIYIQTNQMTQLGCGTSYASRQGNAAQCATLAQQLELQYSVAFSDSCKSQQNTTVNGGSGF